MPIFRKTVFTLFLSLNFVFIGNALVQVESTDHLTQVNPLSYLDTDKFIVIKERINIQTNLTKSHSQDNFSTILLRIESDDNIERTILLDWAQNRKELSFFSLNAAQTRKIIIPADSSLFLSTVAVQIDINVKKDSTILQIGPHTLRLNDLGLSSQNRHKITLFPGLSEYPDSNQPLTIAHTSVYASHQNHSNTNLWAWFIAIILIDIVIFIWYQYRKKRKKASLKTTDSTTEDIILYQEESLIDMTLPQESAIYIFGQFTVLDKEGNDISKSFSPLLRELLLLIIVHSVRGGISSEALKELLWPDKTVASARNNRAVSLAKLRSILQTVGETTIDNEGGHWTLTTQNIFIDYLEYKKLLTQNLQKDDVLKMIMLVSKGNIFPNTEYKWLDSFRSDVSDSAIHTLMKYADLIQIEKEPRLTVKIADFISNFDDLNEKSLYLKCKAYSLMGQHSAAKNTYEKFCEEYENTYGEPFHIPFSKLLEDSPDFHSPI